MSIDMLTIGEISKQSGVGAVTLRYYEKCGLLAPAQRSEGRHRLYPQEMINRLQFIQNATFVGFTLDEIRELLILQDKKSKTSHAVRQFVINKIEIIKDKTRALQEIQNSLENLVSQCDGKMPTQKCPILKNLQQLTTKGLTQSGSSMCAKKVRGC